MAITDKNLIGLDVSPVGFEVMLGNGLTEKCVALFWAIALERGTGGHFLGRCVQCGDTNGGQGLGHIADAETDDRLIRMGGDISVHALGDVGEKIGSFELGEVFVDANHG